LPEVVELKEGERCDVFCFDQDKVERLRDQIPDVSELVRFFKAVADETRAKIISILSKEEVCVCDLAALLGTTVSNVSHHLRILRSARVVRSRRKGKQVYYSLDDEHVMTIIREGLDHVAHR